MERVDVAAALSCVGSGLNAGGMTVAEMGVAEVSTAGTDAHAANIMITIKGKRVFFMLHSRLSSPILNPF
jgi:hypothetical protein